MRGGKWTYTYDNLGNIKTVTDNVGSQTVGSYTYDVQNQLTQETYKMLVYSMLFDSDEDRSKFDIIYTEYKNLMFCVANRILGDEKGSCGGGA